MEVKSFLENIDEEEMKSFLNEMFPYCVESVIKYYDDNYRGYLFQVRFKSGVDYLPKEKNNTIRLGDFSIVKDEQSGARIITDDNFEIALLAPNFFKKYVSFVKEKNIGKTVYGKIYSTVLNNRYSMYFLQRKIAMQKKMEDEERLQKQILSQIFVNDNQEKESE